MSISQIDSPERGETQRTPVEVLGDQSVEDVQLNGETGHSILPDIARSIGQVSIQDEQPIDSKKAETSDVGVGEELVGKQTSVIQEVPKRPMTNLSKTKDQQTGGVQGQLPFKQPSSRSEKEDVDPIKQYLSEIGQYPLLDKEDEIRLAKAYEEGKEAQQILKSGDNLTPAQKRQLQRTVRTGNVAERTFVQSNLRLVVSIAKRYQASGLPLLDLIQEGNLGLMHAVEKFDWRKGFKFSTYATWWIRQNITRGIANTNRTIRLPVHANDLISQLSKAKSRLEKESGGKEVTIQELAVEMDLPHSKVEEILRYMFDTISLNEPVRADADVELGDIQSDPKSSEEFDKVTESTVKDDIEKMLGILDERERAIIKLRFGIDSEYGEPKTLEEVGQHWSLTRERIRQIEARALGKLRHPSNVYNEAHFYDS